MTEESIPDSRISHRRLRISGLVLMLPVLLFYLAASWNQARERVYSQLSTYTRITERQLQQQLREAGLQLAVLSQSAYTNHEPWDDWLSQHRPARSQYSHTALIGGDGQWLASTLWPAQQLPAEPALKQTDVQTMTATGTLYLAAPLIAKGGYYLPFCQRLIRPADTFLCLLTSTSSEHLQWNLSLADDNPVIFRLIRPDGTLLLANLLGLSHQHLLGQPLSSGLQRSLAVGTLSKGASQHFFNIRGLNNSRLLGIARRDENSGLIYVLSLPLSYMLYNWLQDIRWGLLIWLVYAAGLWYLTRPGRRQKGSEPESNKTARREVISALMKHLQGAMYRISLPDHRLLRLTTGSDDIFPPAFIRSAEGHSLINLIHPDDQENYARQMEEKARSYDSWELVYRVMSNSQEYNWLLDRGRVVAREENSTIIEGILVDITDHVVAQQHVEYLATRDPLTELANRYYFNDELINAIGRLRPDNGTLALLFIDLDRFKTINDSLGHHIGDRLLKLVSERLRHLVSADDMLARLGGDEFIVMLLNPGSREVVETLAKTILEHISQPFQLDYYRLTTTCSIGITLSPDDSEESYILLRNADTAMYNAKNKGGNCYQFYNEEMNRQVNTRLTLESELRRAIQNNEFQLFYQAQVASADNTLAGAEALIRWQHPTAGLVSPADFIPVAEETGLIRDIGDWALYEACKQFRQLNQEYGQELTISVNVSVRQLDDAFVRRTAEILQSTGLPPHCLELEITESLLMDNVQENIRLLDEISQLGIRFAMDDFGTGYSSLSYLKQFPISKLKIDQSFIRNITTDSEDEAIVHAIIAMAKSLQLELVAEGVETSEQLQRLQALNCDCYQGYFFSKPVPLNIFRDIVANATHNRLSQPPS